MNIYILNATKKQGIFSKSIWMNCVQLRNVALAFQWDLHNDLIFAINGTNVYLFNSIVFNDIEHRVAELNCSYNEPNGTLYDNLNDIINQNNYNKLIDTVTPQSYFHWVTGSANIDPGNIMNNYTVVPLVL
jgi:hypothetical protein